MSYRLLQLQSNGVAGLSHRPVHGCDHSGMSVNGDARRAQRRTDVFRRLRGTGPCPWPARPAPLCSDYLLPAETTLV